MVPTPANRQNPTADAEPARITTSELTALANEPLSTIDHWADLGLLPFARKGRRRLFDPERSLERCARIRELQNEGQSLPHIRDILEGGAK